MKTKILSALVFIFWMIISAATPASGSSPDIQGQNIETNSVKVYPNPVTGTRFQVQAQKNIEEIRVVNILGQKAETGLYRKNTNQAEVSLQNKKQGIYLVTVVFDDKTSEVIRIIVK